MLSCSHVQIQYEYKERYKWGTRGCTEVQRSGYSLSSDLLADLSAEGISCGYPHPFTQSVPPMTKPPEVVDGDSWMDGDRDRR